MLEDSSYCSFLLRVWRRETATVPRLHVSLEDTRTGERYGFHDLRQMAAFLEQPPASKPAALPPSAPDETSD